jgi:hypothetical protein
MKIKRLEEDVQTKYDENLRLKDELISLRKLNEDLTKKLDGISEFFK